MNVISSSCQLAVWTWKGKDKERDRSGGRRDGTVDLKTHNAETFDDVGRVGITTQACQRFRLQHWHTCLHQLSQGLYSWGQVVYTNANGFVFFCFVIFLYFLVFVICGLRPLGENAIKITGLLLEVWMHRLTIIMYIYIYIYNNYCYYIKLWTVLKQPSNLIFPCGRGSL